LNAGPLDGEDRIDPMEAQLIEAAQRGDRDAFATLVRGRADRLYADRSAHPPRIPGSTNDGSDPGDSGISATQEIWSVPAVGGTPSA
jgi:hypothetical protein